MLIGPCFFASISFKMTDFNRIETPRSSRKAKKQRCPLTVPTPVWRSLQPKPKWADPISAQSPTSSARKKHPPKFRSQVCFFYSRLQLIADITLFLFHMKLFRRAIKWSKKTLAFAVKLIRNEFVCRLQSNHAFCIFKFMDIVFII